LLFVGNQFASFLIGIKYAWDIMLPCITKYNVLFMTTGQFSRRKGDEGKTYESWRRPIRCMNSSSIFFSFPFS
jgi:hypothetical protein